MWKNPFLLKNYLFHIHVSHLPHLTVSFVPFQKIYLTLLAKSDPLFFVAFATNTDTFQFNGDFLKRNSLPHSTWALCMLLYLVAITGVDKTHLWWLPVPFLKKIYFKLYSFFVWKKDGQIFQVIPWIKFSSHLQDWKTISMQKRPLA